MALCETGAVVGSVSGGCIEDDLIYRFTQAYAAASVCSPSRAALMTGQSPARLKITTFLTGRTDRSSHRLLSAPINLHLPAGVPTIAELLKPKGYVSAAVGKWHLGSDPTGFDRWIVLPGQGNYVNPQFLVPGHALTIEGHCTDVTGDLAIEFLKTRPQDKPFFLMLSKQFVAKYGDFSKDLWNAVGQTRDSAEFKSKASAFK